MKPLTPEEQRMYHHMREEVIRTMGRDDVSSTEALEIAVSADETAKIVSPHDPCRRMFNNQAKGWLEYAALLERLGR